MKDKISYSIRCANVPLAGVCLPKLTLYNYFAAISEILFRYLRPRKHTSSRFFLKEFLADNKLVKFASRCIIVMERVIW